MSIVPVYDSTHANIDRLPAGQRYAGYTTGSPSVRWTDADWKSHPGAVRIDQDPGGHDETADAFDVETFAGRNGDAAGWYRHALSSYTSAKRPGQRRPAIYTSAANVTPLVNALVAGGVRSGPKLWVAHWGETDADARAEVRNAAGPYPIIAVQNHNLGTDDESMMSGGWLADVSAKGPFKHVTDGKTSITGYASSRKMHAGGWLALQQKVGGNSVGDALGSAVPKAGLTWYSVHE